MSAIFINKRPIKIAFLVNPQQSDWQGQIDAICDFGQDKWGGRYYPIVPTDGTLIGADWWHFLGELDPDYVISVFPLADSLVAEIRKRINPIDVELPKPNGDQKPLIFTSNEGLSVYPNQSTVSKFQRIISNNVLAAVRGIHWTGETEVFRFLLQNFGVFDDIYPLDRVLEKVEKKEVFRANNTQELADMLKGMTKPMLDFVYPIQYSMFGKPSWYLELENEHAYENFGLIVGDTFDDQLFLRNKIFYERDSSHTRIRHLWIPKFFYEDAELMSALGAWLLRVTKEVHLFSFSVTKAKLLKIAEKLDLKTDSQMFLNSLRKDVTTYKNKKFPFPKFPVEHKFSFCDRISHPLAPPKDGDFHRSSQLEDSFSVESPSQLEGFTERGYWMAEVFIEVDKSRFYHQKEFLPQTGTFWWQLPRKNYLARDIFKGKARIDSRGIPVVQLPGKNPVLSFKLPSEFQLVRSCLLGDWKGRMAGEVKRKHLEIEEAQPSNIGKYLSGFLEVFGGLALAHGYLEEKYWRDMFDILSGRDFSKEPNLKVEVKNTLRKRIRQDRTKNEIVSNFESLDDYVIELSKKVAFDGKPLKFKDLLKAKIKEHKAFKAHHGLDYPFDTSALRRSMSNLLELGVLQMGLSQKCPRCGSVNWYSIDESKQHSICTGCRYEFSLHATPECSYKLSSLARRGIFAHGLVPVTLALGQMLNDSRSSFFYGPCMDLFKIISNDPLKYERITDSDIVCIKDGKFIIGEIKQSQNQFTLRQMELLAEIAEIIEADVLLFSSQDKQLETKTETMIEKVKEQLKNSNIEVCWYQLDVQMFDPSRGDC